MSLDDLPNEILSAVAKRLGYCDVLSFRLVCKRFLRASNSATAEIESTREPLFLIHLAMIRQYEFQNFPTPESPDTVGCVFISSFVPGLHCGRGKSPNGRGIRLCPKNLIIQKFDLLSNVDLATQHPPFPPFPIFELRKNYVRFVGLKKRLGLEENNRDSEIVTCGTVMMSLDNHNKLVVIFNKAIAHRSAGYQSKALYKGVWIHPRYHTPRAAHP
ncbi:hypothetical protein FEM48_Zijuj09G0141600 [Ziziphus jujuba var. spinosa]|uniref:F-box domain-containing protein n=1 Tax=Ziziphus jujuba var. spinosa TaxID=714518 RepID=A0A978UTF4_ZIZJJ|nr:hypothetical protein FEM48_Zijuj09G0141600 [Ziziphus jujuba var. spinosa]